MDQVAQYRVGQVEGSAMRPTADKWLNQQLTRLGKRGGLTFEITGGNHVLVTTNNGHRELLPFSPRNPRSCIGSLKRIEQNIVRS